jgi:hypothetical protein
MKKLILTLTASLACVAAFAQGRISFQTDSLHLAYYGTSAANGSLAGTPISSANLPVGVTLVADLYMGTSSTSLNLYSSTTFSVNGGKWNTLSVTAPTIAGGTTVYVVTQIRDQAFAAPTTWTSNSVPFGTFYGESQEFTFVLGTSSLQYPPMYTTGASLGGGLSTWAVGTYNMDSLSTGFRGAISVNAVPEPATFALAGLGLAAVTIFRRRK